MHNGWADKEDMEKYPFIDLQLTKTSKQLIEMFFFRLVSVSKFDLIKSSAGYVTC